MDSIRGDFHLVPSLRASAEAAGRELMRLTDEHASFSPGLARTPASSPEAAPGRERRSSPLRKQDA